MARNSKLTPAILAQVDQDVATIDTTIEKVLAALRAVAGDVNAEPGLAVALVMRQMDGLPMFHLKALAARLLVRLSQTEAS